MPLSMHSASAPVFVQIMLGRGRPDTMGYADDNLYQRRGDHLNAAE